MSEHEDNGCISQNFNTSQYINVGIFGLEHIIEGKPYWSPFSVFKNRLSMLQFEGPKSKRKKEIGNF